MTKLAYIRKLEEFDGRPIKELEEWMCQWYPFSSVHFDASGIIYIHTGMWAGGNPVTIPTRFGEGKGERLKLVHS